MSAALLRCALSFTRLWARVYTSGMEPELGDRRCSEIDSYLWETQRDLLPTGRPAFGVAAQIVGCLLLGVPDDLMWRLEETRTRKQQGPEGRTVMTFTKLQTRWMGFAAMLGGAAWMLGNLYRIFTGNTGAVRWTMLVSPVLFALGLLAFHSRQAGRGGRLGTAGLLLTLAGFAIVLIGALGNNLGFYWVSNYLYGPVFAIVLPLGIALFGIGAVRAGEMRAGRRHLPLILGAILVAAALVGFAGIFLQGRGPLMDFSEVVLMYGLGLGWVAMGYVLWLPDRSPAAPAG